jgi:hypothetical protein
MVLSSATFQSNPKSRCEVVRIQRAMNEGNITVRPGAAGGKEGEQWGMNVRRLRRGGTASTVTRKEGFCHIWRGWVWGTFLRKVEGKKGSVKWSM